MSRTSRVLWVIRSGETAWDTGGRLYGGEDLPLTDAGRLATLEAIERTPALVLRGPSVVHFAPDDASKSTAKLICAASGSKPRIAHDLAEPELGVLAGLSRDELRDRFERRSRQWDDDPSDLVPPEGEPFAEARRRILGGVVRILKRSRADTIGIVTHGFASGFLRAGLAGDPAGNPRRWMDGRPRIEAWVLPTDATQRLSKVLQETVGA